MGSIEWRITLGGILALTQVACGESKPQVFPTQSPTPVIGSPRVEPTPTITAALEPQPLSDKRKRGMQLENLDFDQIAGRDLGLDGEYGIGNISIVTLTSNFALRLDAQQFLPSISECQVDQIKERVVIQLADYITDEKGNPLKSGDRVNLSLIEDKIYIQFALIDITELDLTFLQRGYEVTPGNEKRALENYTTAHVNAEITRMICMATDLSNKNKEGRPQGLSLEEHQEINKKWFPVGGKIFSQIFNGQMQPFLIIKFEDLRLPGLNTI